MSVVDEVARRTPRDDDPIFNDAIVKNVPREVIEQFLKAWQYYPVRAGGNPRRMALRAWLKQWRRKASLDDMLTATHHYRAHCKSSNAIGTVFVMHAATFFGPNDRWMDYIEPPSIEVPADEMEQEIRETWLRGELRGTR
jgi:hypothetical protein